MFRTLYTLLLIPILVALGGCRNTRVQVFNETIIGDRSSSDPRPLRYGAALRLRSFNPNGAEGWCEATALIHAGLFTVDHEGRVVGDLVTDSRIEEDGRVWRLWLHPEARFHDGAPLTSRDVVATLEALEELEGSRIRDSLRGLRGARAISSRELVLELEAPLSELPGILSDLAILPAHALQQETPLGAGPYAVIDATPSVVFLQAHHRYHRGPPRSEYVTLPIIEDDRQRARALADGVIDLAAVSPESLGPLEDPARFRIHRLPSGVVRAIPLDLAAEGLGDPRVRRALGALIDRQALVPEARADHAQPAWHMVPLEVGLDHSHASAVVGIPRDARDAGALLDAAGWPRSADGLRRSSSSGRPLRLRLAAWPGEAFGRGAAPLIVAAWRAAGIEASLVTVDRAADLRFAREAGGGFEGYVGAWGGGLIAPVSALERKFRRGGSENHTGFEDPTLESLLDAASREESLSAQQVLVARALERLASEMPWIPLAYPESVIAVSTAVEGFDCRSLRSRHDLPRHLWRMGLRPR